MNKFIITEDTIEDPTNIIGGSPAHDKSELNGNRVYINVDRISSIKQEDSKIRIYLDGPLDSYSIYYDNKEEADKVLDSFEVFFTDSESILKLK